MADTDVKDTVKEYYGKVLKKSEDLKTDACCPLGVKFPKHVKEAMALIHEEVSSKYYGCGLVIPEHLEGMRVLDLGSGAGQDCFILSKLVGPKGHVTGLDMTKEQLDVANAYIGYHMEKFGHKEHNIDFVQGYIEKLGEAGLKDEAFDIIVSNCVVNLSPDKRAVLKEAHRVLKEGGELYFSDVYADRDLPEEVRKHKVLWGECVAGALWWKDLVKLAGEVGFSRPRLCSCKTLTIQKEDLKQVLGDAKFVSVEYRLFKLPKKFEQARQVIYEGTIPECPDQLEFDWRHTFKNGDVVGVDAELSTILESSRFQEAFSFQPPSKKPVDDGTCCPDQDIVVDPFEYIKSGGCSATKGCC